MALAPGTRLGPYGITAPLGSGGMGEVYRAKDTRLERSVAIKILPPEFSLDAVRRQRFEREAKTISSLNHPHICVLHDVGHQEGIEYLVMECIEGDTVAKRLEKGPLPLEQALKYGAQIADALDKWVAYNSNESGKWEVYVTSFPEPRGKWQVSTAGGEQPRWRSDGKELFYLSSDDQLMAVPVTTGPRFSSGSPVTLFPTNARQPVSYLDVFTYDVTRDGQRFVINTDVKPAETVPVSVVLNWTSKLKK